MDEITQIKQQILDTIPVDIKPCVRQRILLVGDLSTEQRERSTELLKSSLQDLKDFLNPKNKGS